ncbi:MAG: F0F1 ATP synthase subunit B [Betaproteobacteria bacterium]|jgi:F-type H+-transporting ATPase subunit b|nr:MAG: F0F1 ATP synthase subunit B [Betaproteobacteria bacterium]
MNLNATLFFQTVVLVVAGWVTMQFIWPMLRDTLDARRQKIADGLAAAEQGTKSLGEAQRRIAQLDAEARARAQALIADTEKRAHRIIEDAKAQAKVEGDRLIQAARAEAEQQVVRAKTVLRDQVAALAVAGAEQILKREVDAKVHVELLDQLKARL